MRSSLSSALRLRAVLLLVVALLAAACGDSSSWGTSGASLRVVATTGLAAFAKVIGGDRVQVYGVLKPNVDPHEDSFDGRSARLVRR